MKRAIKCICLVLVVALMLPVSAMAAERPSAETYSLFFVSYDTWLYKLTDVKFEIGFDVTAKRTMQELGVSSIQIQRSANGVSGWSTRKTFTPDVYTQMIDENTVCNMDYVTYVGTYGYYYRAKAVFYAKDSSGSATLTDYSQVIYIPPNS